MAFLSRKDKTPLGIYIHVPFCRSKCEYCDFYSVTTKEDGLMDEYLDAICTHIRESGNLAPGYKVDTVYFGGGTPSFFGAEGMASILTTIRKSFDVTDDAEITFEANPDSISDKLLRRLRGEGFNRVSLGIQCDDDEILKKIGRPHSYAQAVTAVQRIRKAGFRNLSLDLIYGLPGQTRHAWQETLQQVLMLSPDHISCYGLKVEEGTPLYQYKDYCNLPDDDTQADMYLDAVEILRTRGYRQYEISNFCRKGQYSRHNMKYWKGGEYLGFGPSASSDFAGKRFTIVRSLRQYIDGELAMDYSFTYTYDGQGRQVSMDEYLSGELLFHVALSYDAEGREIGSVTSLVNGEVQSRTESQWDGLTETRLFFSGEETEPFMISVFTYDDNGDVVFEETRQGDTVINRAEYIYEPFEVKK